MANEIPGLGSQALKTHLQRRAQRTLEEAQYDQVATVLRYRVTVAGSPEIGIAPTVAEALPVDVLENLACSVSEIGQEEGREREPGLTAIWANPLRFAFRDIPATPDPVVAAGRLLLSDFLLYAGEKYRIHQVGGSDPSSIAWCVASLWQRG